MFQEYNPSTGLISAIAACLVEEGFKIREGLTVFRGEPEDFRIDTGEREYIVTLKDGCIELSEFKIELNGAGPYNANFVYNTIAEIPLADPEVFKKIKELINVFKHHQHPDKQ